MSGTAINYVREEATVIRVAGLLKLRATFVSPIITESHFLLSPPISQIVSEERR